MSRNSSIKREARKYRDTPDAPFNVLEYEQSKHTLVPLNEHQSEFISKLSHDDLVIGAGCAGTGKTYLASRIAGRLYTANKNIKHIILTRPNIEVGKSLGFLPGELTEKYAPYLEPFEKGLKDQLGPKYAADLWKNILPQPLCYMRGKTFDDSIILLDEAQNTTIAEMQMFLTRVGTNSRIFITGDQGNQQNDLRVTENGLQWLIRQMETQKYHVKPVIFVSDDCVRSALCMDMLKLIENEKK